MNLIGPALGTRCAPMKRDTYHLLSRILGMSMWRGTFPSLRRRKRTHAVSPRARGVTVIEALSH